MPNEKSAIDEFLGGLNKAQENPFESADPFASKEETETVVEEEKEEKRLSFAKDPKVQRYVEKEISKALANFKPATATETFSKEAEDDITDVLTRIIGNDTPEKLTAVKDFRKVLGSLEEKGAERALAKFQEQAQQAKEQDLKVQRDLDASFEEIEETYGVDLSSNTGTARKARSEFVDYVRKIAPKNEEGEVVGFPDMLSAFEEFQERNKRPANRAKELSARSMSRSSGASEVQATTGKSWKDVERMFSKLN